MFSIIMRFRPDGLLAGQEAVVVWLLHFANSSNSFATAAERTVNHILSYMRSSATWAYNGGSRSWGDLGVQH